MAENHDLFVQGMRLRLLLIFLLGVLAGPTYAQKTTAPLDQKLTRALNNLQHEMSTCVAYYSVTKRCFDPTKDAVLVQGHEEVANQLIKLSSAVGKSIAMTDDAIMSRFGNETEEMMTVMNNSSSTSHLYFAGIQPGARLSSRMVTLS
jgi:hypothetical protein